MKMRVAVLILAAVIQFSARALDVSEADSLDWVLFESFMTNHSRTYTDDTQLGYRFQVFQVTFQAWLFGVHDVVIIKFSHDYAGKSRASETAECLRS